jgi:hypothetical protein
VGVAYRQPPQSNWIDSRSHKFCLTLIPHVQYQHDPVVDSDVDFHLDALELPLLTHSLAQ